MDAFIPVGEWNTHRVAQPMILPSPAPVLSLAEEEEGPGGEAFKDNIQMAVAIL